MYKLDFFRLIVLPEHSFPQSTSIIVKVVKPAEHTTKQPDITYAPQLLTPICLITIWVIALFIFLPNIRKFSRHGKVAIFSLQQVPCKKCQFFVDNNYLRCAVHPSIVLTKQSLNCSDYCPKSSPKN